MHSKMLKFEGTLWQCILYLSQQTVEVLGCLPACLRNHKLDIKERLNHTQREMERATQLVVLTK